ncbi:MAG: thiolase family protein [Thermodesulfobacteriota bacterium]|nr:thiolase family protein [Thermodesulfobacteriota bacterium]
MNDKVAIVGIGMKKQEPKTDETLYDMIFEASALALSNAGLEREDLDSIVLAASDLVDGISISSMVTATAAGAYLKDEIKVADDGIFGLALACLRIMTGQFSNSIVVGWSKCSQGSINNITSLNFDPFYHRPAALNLITSSALQANRYMKKYGVKPEEAARVAVNNRKNALNNPLACLRNEVTMDEVLASRTLAEPLKALDMSCFCDGVCAMVLANEEQARDLTDTPVWIRGLGWSTDTYHLGDRELAELPSLRESSQKAYRMAGIQNPVDEIDVAEVYDLTTYHQLMALEGLGFCGLGEGGGFLADDRLPINPSGGLISSNPWFASGLIRVAEGALQVLGRAEGRQVENAETALAHGVSGLCYQKNCVAILGR